MCRSPEKVETILGSLLPKEINGWKAREKDKVFDPETIFDYIDGAGEIYRAYNFKKLLARNFSKQGKPGIIADLFDMESSRNAFGVFTHDLDGEDVGVGKGSTYKGGLLSFWKGRFFVSLYAEEETDETRDALLALGKKVAFSIKKEGEKPRIVSLFPQEHLFQDRIHYFFNHIILNYHFFVADENILLLGEQTEAALGIYRDNDEKYYLLLVRYPEAGKASVAYNSFINVYMPDALEPGIVQTEDLKWTAAKLKEDLLIIVFDVPTGSRVKEMIEEVGKDK